MIDPGKTVKESSEPSPKGPGGKMVLTAMVFGLAFGFLLQKGGVAKYNVLIGQLLLQDFTVVKIMVSAIIVGMVGIFTLNHFAKVNLHLKPTRIGAQMIGGSLFGAGFALLATTHHLANIVAAAERRVGTGDDQAAHTRVLRTTRQSLEFAVHAMRQRIPGLGPVQRDDTHTVAIHAPGDVAHAATVASDRRRVSGGRP